MSGCETDSEAITVCAPGKATKPATGVQKKHGGRGSSDERRKKKGHAEEIARRFDDLNRRFEALESTVLRLLQPVETATPEPPGEDTEPSPRGGGNPGFLSALLHNLLGGRDPQE